jgi:hypothetical protein
VITDKFGRVMRKTSPNLSNVKLPSKNRLPMKRPPPKRKLSFTESQLQYYGADDIYNPIARSGKQTLTEVTIIEFMKEVSRFPCPEALLGRQSNKRYKVTIDSLIVGAYSIKAVEEWADYKPDTKAPYNSMESDENFFLYESQSSEDPNSVPYITAKAVKADPTLKEKQFDIRILEISPYRMESMKFFPHRTHEGEVPYKLLHVGKLSYLFEAAPKILEQQKDARWSSELI